MSEATGGGDPAELYARVQAATAGSTYRLQRTEQGFNLTADVPQPPSDRGRITQMHTYRVELRPREGTFTMTDVVRTQERGRDGLPRRTVTTGRSRYRTWGRAVDGSEQQHFSSAEGHRLIRGAAEALGWRELRPVSTKVALGFGVVGGVVALGTLIALAVVFWL
ncbi:hypothetical protein ABZ721_12800 [Streptomyces sp. NPDC006733]|uniref:hypothetical protein n=1 Tax=Streptomyces sp. NPDC006733 TaxID=3155460 RepID=UPI0033E762CA